MDNPAPQPPTVASVLRAAIACIGAEDARWLLAHVLQKTPAWLYAHDDAVVESEARRAYEALVRRRQDGEPVAYLTGRRGFWSLELHVSPATLIPRPETELLVELALARLPVDAAVDVADLGTGSGAIALAIAHERPRVRVLATDASAGALDVAQGNARRLGLGNVAFAEGDWCAPLAGRQFHLIASNPPYIETGDAHLQQGDLRFEPASALSSGADGLDAIRCIANDARAHLHPGGWLLMEHGWNQGTAVRALLQAAGYAQVASECDLEQRERVTFGQWCPAT